MHCSYIRPFGSCVSGSFCCCSKQAKGNLWVRVVNQGVVTLISCLPVNLFSPFLKHGTPLPLPSPPIHSTPLSLAFQALLTLLISNNFAEIKSSVFKKFDKHNLFQLSCHDVVERFKLALFLAMIMLLNVCQGGLDDPVSQVGGQIRRLFCCSFCQRPFGRCCGCVGVPRGLLVSVCWLLRVCCGRGCASWSSPCLLSIMVPLRSGYSC